MIIIIFLGIYLSSILLLNWLYISLYKDETDQDEVTIQEYYKENTCKVIFSFIPIFNTIILIMYIICMLLLGFWELIKEIKL